MKKVLLWLAHAALVGANAYVAYRYPALAPFVGPTLATANATLPSPFSIAKQ